MKRRSSSFSKRKYKSRRIEKLSSSSGSQPATLLVGSNGEIGIPTLSDMRPPERVQAHLQGTFGSSDLNTSHDERARLRYEDRQKTYVRELEERAINSELIDSGLPAIPFGWVKDNPENPYVSLFNTVQPKTFADYERFAQDLVHYFQTRI